MATLEGFPIISQLDGDINAQMDCVATSLASGLTYLTHKKYTGSQVKDAVYGVNYVGPTNPPNYVQYCQEQGVQLTSINGNPAYLITAIQQQIALGNPCLITVPDRYAPASLGWTHVLAVFGSTSLLVQAMDPYIAKSVTYGTSELEGLLQFDQIWVLSGGEIVLSIQQAQGYFVEVQPDQVWKCKQTGFTVSHGILAYYRSCTNNNLNGLSILGLPLTEEQSIPGYTGCTIQRFERSCIIYDPENKIDKVPGVSGPCYLAHIDKGPGRDPAIAQLLNENSQALDRIAKLEQDLKEAQIPPTISTEKQ